MPTLPDVLTIKNYKILQSSPDWPLFFAAIFLALAFYRVRAKAFLPLIKVLP